MVLSLHFLVLSLQGSPPEREPPTTLVLTVAALLVNVVQAYFWTYSSATGICQLRPEVT